MRTLSRFRNRCQSRLSRRAAPGRARHAVLPSEPKKLRRGRSRKQAHSSPEVARAQRTLLPATENRRAHIRRGRMRARQLRARQSSESERGDLWRGFQLPRDAENTSESSQWLLLLRRNRQLHAHENGHECAAQRHSLRGDIPQEKKRQSCVEMARLGTD